MASNYTVTLTLPNGTRKYYHGKTKKEAEDKRAKDRVALGQGLDIWDTTTFETLSAMWYELYKKGKIHKRSEETIVNVIDRYINPVLGSFMVKNIRPLHIQILMNSVAKYSNSTQKKVIQYTRAIFRMAVDNRLIAASPVTSDIKAGGATPKEVVPLTDEQIVNLLNVCKETRAYPFLAIILFAGLRKGEVLGLMWKDIDFEAHTLTVNQSIVYPEDNRLGEINYDLKTANAHRTIPMVKELEDILLAEKEKNKGLYVLCMSNGKFLSDASFRRMWDLVTSRIDYDLHPHQLRHTCATRWVRNGLPPKTVQYLLGHKSIDVTMEIYTHYMEESQRQQTAMEMQRMMPCLIG